MAMLKGLWPAKADDVLVRALAWPPALPVTVWFKYGAECVCVCVCTCVCISVCVRARARACVCVLSLIHI